MVAGELAVDLTNKRLYTENSGGTVLEVGSNPYNFTANHDGSAKLATTPTGIDVTGTVTADGLTVHGTYNFTSAVNGTINNPASCFINIDSDNNNAGESFYLSRHATNTAGARVAKFDAIGDISFYEDTGTTPKFFWDASAESLGIDTSSPA